MKVLIELVESIFEMIDTEIFQFMDLSRNVMQFQVDLFKNSPFQDIYIRLIAQETIYIKS